VSVRRWRRSPSSVLWVWNDYLVGVDLHRAKPDVQVLTCAADISGSRATTGICSPRTVVSMALPLIVFFALQRFFVESDGGSVKGKNVKRET